MCNIIFFLFGHGLHRALHSFPTRRSSDLFADARNAPIVGRGASDGDRFLSDSPSEPAIDLEYVGQTLRRLASEVDRGLDRKSTRLNSSHVSISYAVFCLKKKRKNIRDIIN